MVSMYTSVSIWITGVQVHLYAHDSETVWRGLLYTSVWGIGIIGDAEVSVCVVCSLLLCIILYTV